MNITPQNAVIIKVDDIGTKHPIISRLYLQSIDFLQWTSLSKDDVDKIIDIVHDELKPALKECFSIANRIEKHL